MDVSAFFVATIPGSEPSAIEPGLEGGMATKSTKDSGVTPGVAIAPIGARKSGAGVMDIFAFFVAIIPGSEPSAIELGLQGRMATKGARILVLRRESPSRL